MAAHRIALGASARTAETVVDCDGPDYNMLIDLSNPTSSFHCFKLKTNAPRRWSVRPNGGVLAPGETATLSIRFILRAQDLRGLEDDRHLIVSAPVSAEDAAALREQRELHPRASPPRPDADEPEASRTHVTPRFVSLPASVSASNGPAAPAIDAQSMYSPFAASVPPSPLVEATVGASPVIDVNGRQTSVAEAVAAIEDQHVPTAAHDPPAKHGLGSRSAADAGDSEDENERKGEVRPPPRPVTLLRRLLSFLSAMGDEFTPWVSYAHARPLPSAARTRPSHIPSPASR